MVKTGADELTRAALAKINSVSTLPEVTSKIIKMVDDPRSTPAQLNKVISHDPALVARTLKVVNSPFYGLPGKVDSVERAIVLLGFNGVKNIALAASLGTLFRGVNICEGHSARDLWFHCVLVALTAKQLAKELKLPVGEEAFLAGMIHDLGLLVALQVWPDKLRAACDTIRGGGATSFCQAERDAMGVDHQQLGQALAAAWKFPALCQSVAGNHHNPSRANESERALVGLVHAADSLACNAKAGFFLTAERQQVQANHPPLAADPAAADRVRAQMPQLVDAAKQLC